MDYFFKNINEPRYRHWMELILSAVIIKALTDVSLAWAAQLLTIITKLRSKGKVINKRKRSDFFFFASWSVSCFCFSRSEFLIVTEFLATRRSNYDKASSVAVMESYRWDLFTSTFFPVYIL